jgi:hypothetical protein
VAANRSEGREDVARVLKARAEEPRRQELRDDVPAGLIGFGAVVGIVFGNAFPETGLTVAVKPHEEEMLVTDAAEAGFEEVDKGKPQEPEFEPIDPHDTIPILIPHLG